MKTQNQELERKSLSAAPLSNPGPDEAIITSPGFFSSDGSVVQPAERQSPKLEARGSNPRRPAKPDIPSSAIIYADGGLKRYNPGPAGIGFVIQTEDDQILQTGSRAIGKATNNEAEYLAVIKAVEEALNLGITHIKIRSDSLLIVNQINDRWRVKKQHLFPLYKQAKALLMEFDSWKIVHIRRDLNKRADKLASQAL